PEPGKTYKKPSVKPCSQSPHRMRRDGFAIVATCLFKEKLNSSRILLTAVSMKEKHSSWERMAWRKRCDLLTKAFGKTTCPILGLCHHAVLSSGFFFTLHFI